MGAGLVGAQVELFGGAVVYEFGDAGRFGGKMGTRIDARTQGGLYQNPYERVIPLDVPIVAGYPYRRRFANTRC